RLLTHLDPHRGPDQATRDRHQALLQRLGRQSGSGEKEERATHVVFDPLPSRQSALPIVVPQVTPPSGGCSFSNRSAAPQRKNSHLTACWPTTSQAWSGEPCRASGTMGVAADTPRLSEV